MSSSRSFYTMDLEVGYRFLYVALVHYYIIFLGLPYALIVIDRSDVAEMIKTRESKECSTDALSFFFSTEGGDQPECSRDIGESCDPEGKPSQEDKNKLTCCANPVAVIDEEGNKYMF